MIIKTGARAVTPKVETPPAVIPYTPGTIHKAPTAPDPFNSPSYKDMPAYVPPKLSLPADKLTIYKELEQGTPEWFDARCGVLTASVVHQLLTAGLKVADNLTSKSLTMAITAERITNYVEPMATTRDMERGNLDEPYAREVYSERYAPVTEAGFMVREINGYRLGYSPDGLVADDGLIEIKSRKQKIQLGTFLDDEVPGANMAQIQTGLLVSGRDWLDYVSYTGGMPPYVKRVYPDQKWFAAIIAALVQFETNAADMLDKYLAATEGNPPTERIDHFAEMEITF
jgi:YqaJ-like viral recombinase domain